MLKYQLNILIKKQWKMMNQTIAGANYKYVSTNIYRSETEDNLIISLVTYCNW